MSCVQLDPAHIAALVKFAAQHRPGNAGPLSYYTPGPEGERGEWHGITRETAGEVAAILARANANAYAERYREITAPVQVPAALITGARELSAVQVLMACRSYEYQTSGWSEYDTSAADGIIKAITRRAIDCLPGFDDADTWEITETDREYLARRRAEMRATAAQVQP